MGDIFDRKCDRKIGLPIDSVQMGPVVSTYVNEEQTSSWGRAYAEQLDDERRTAGMSYDVLAGKTEISRSTLIRYAKGTREIGTIDLLRILDALGVDLHRFIDRAAARRDLF